MRSRQSVVLCRINNQLVEVGLFDWDDKCHESGFTGELLKLVNDVVGAANSLDSWSLRGSLRDGFVIAELRAPLRGGKGGFGSLLKSKGSKRKVAVANQSSARGLDGDRLRYAQSVQKLQDWKAKQQRDRQLIKCLGGEDPFLGKPVSSTEVLQYMGLTTHIQHKAIDLEGKQNPTNLLAAARRTGTERASSDTLSTMTGDRCNKRGRWAADSSAESELQTFLQQKRRCQTGVGSQSYNSSTLNQRMLNLRAMENNSTPAEHEDDTLSECGRDWDRDEYLMCAVDPPASPAQLPRAATDGSPMRCS